MDTIDFGARLLSVVPQAFRDMPWVSGLISGIATQVQQLDDSTLVMARLLRSIEETPITHDCIQYSSGAAAVGAVVSSLPTIWVSEIGVPAIGTTLTQVGGATGVVASHIFDSSNGLLRIELSGVTGTWVVGAEYSGTGTVGVCQVFTPAASGTISEIVSGTSSDGVCRLTGVTGTFNPSSIALFPESGSLNGQASFNGTTSKIALPSFNKPTTWSMNWWMTPEAGSNNIAWMLPRGGGNVFFGRDASSTNWLLVAGASYPTMCNLTNDVRVMVTITYDGTYARCYKDGTLVSGPTAIAITDATGVGYFGTLATSFFYKGKLDEAVLWNRELTAGEASNLYNSGAGTETLSGSLASGALHQWHFNGDSLDSIGSTHGTDTAVTYSSITGLFLSKLYSLDNAWLTNLGKLVGFERAEESDDVTVRYLRSQIATNVGWGRIQDLYKVGASLFGDGNVYVDDGGESQSTVPGFGMASRGPMTVTVGPVDVVTVKETDYQRTKAQLLSVKPAGVALWLAAHRTATGLGTPFRFGLPQAAINTTPNVDTDILWNLLGFTGDLSTGRYYHTATRLLDGRVLVTGGIGPSTAATATCEVWDPTTGTWTPASSMSQARYYHRAHLLADGRVLVVGGTNGSVSLATCEIFNPATNTWAPTGSLGTARVTATAVLASGDIIACGGFGTADLATCEIYSVSAGTWSNTGSMLAARSFHTATTLTSGQVLVAGGVGRSSTETFNPASSTWTSAGSMTSARYYHTATLLSTGKVLLIDGSSASTSCDLFDPTPRTCTATGSLPSAQTRHATSLLADGNVLIAGGVGTGNCNKYTVSTGTWEVMDSLNSPRNGATATLTETGIVLVAGGFYVTPQVTCEVYSPSITGEPCAVFNGTTSVITTPALGPSGAQARSMGCAFYQPAATPAQYFLGYGTTTPGQAFQFKIDSSTISIDIGGTSYPFGTCIPGEWHYVVVTYDGTTLKGYADGTLGLTLPITLTTAAIGVFRIGAGPSGVGFTRCISHAHLHNRAITATQVQILYNNGNGPDWQHLDGAGDGIIHYYPLISGMSTDFASQFPGWPLVGSAVTQTSPAATGTVHSYTPAGYDSGYIELSNVTGTWTTGSPYTWTYGGGTVGAVGHSGSHFEAPPTPTDTFISIETV